MIEARPQQARSARWRLRLSIALVLVACSPMDPGPTTPTSQPTETKQGADPSGEPAVSILVDGNIITMNGAGDVVEALAVGADDRILAVGDTSTIRAAHQGPNTVVIDLQGGWAMPGFVDPHTHTLQHVAHDPVQLPEAASIFLVQGVTTAGMPSVQPRDLENLVAFADGGNLVTRSHLYLVWNSACGDRPYGEFWSSHPFARDPDQIMNIAGVKVFADGGVCGGPATSIEYLPTTPDALKAVGWMGNGDLFVSSAEVAEVVSAVDAQGGSMVIHAVGDVALAEVLAGYDRAATETGGLTQPHRVDHNSMVGLLSAEQLGAFGRAGVWPIVQFSPWANACNREGLFASIFASEILGIIEDRSFIARANPGIEFAWHGDNPWIPGTPFEQIYSVVTRGAVNPDNGEICEPEGWDHFPLVSIEEAFRMTTINAARAMGFDEHVGSLEVGKFADIIALRANPFGEDTIEAIARNGPTFLLMGGKAAFCDGEASCDRIKDLVAVP